VRNTYQPGGVHAGAVLTKAAFSGVCFQVMLRQEWNLRIIEGIALLM
jgi:hypothetical protein